ncbi:hypothetical protein, partial [Sphingomonas sp. S-NIH.Pt15_0812]|uniref:hypothetical protein n=1 Tax=Sphingomonas sp. S-NIH.Pt15_0812 TaxID=1920129 RepID=UPI0019D20097
GTFPAKSHQPPARAGPSTMACPSDRPPVTGDDHESDFMPLGKPYSIQDARNLLWPANPPISTINDGVKTVLDPNGIAMITSANPPNAQDYNTATDELQWWTPTATRSLNVTYSGSQTLASNSISSNAF